MSGLTHFDAAGNAIMVDVEGPSVAAGIPARVLRDR